MGSKPDNVIRIPCNATTFYRYWLKFLSPFHSLTDREIDLAAALLKTRQELSKSVLDPVLLDEALMSDSVLKKIRDDLGMAPPYFICLKTSLKKKKFIVDGKINKRLIPNISDENSMFQLLLLFDFEK